MLEGVCQIVADESKPASSTDLGGLIRNLHELTKIAEREMHAVVLSCARARRQMLGQLPPSNPPLRYRRPPRPAGAGRGALVIAHGSGLPTWSRLPHEALRMILDDQVA